MTDPVDSTHTRRTRSHRRFALVAAAAFLATAISLLVRTTSSSTHVQSSSSRLRRRLASATVPTDPTFRWNGSTSDLAQQFYRRHVAGATADALSYVDADLPARIQARLTKFELTFTALPPLLQRALVWDSGYAFSPEPARKFIRMYSVNGVPMSQIAVSMAEYLSAECITTDCRDPTGAATFRSKTCSGSMMLSVAHCASDEVTDGMTHMSMWATGGGDDTAIPAMNIERHSWDDKVFGGSYLVFAVHTTSDANEPAWDNCPRDGVYNSAIIPCELYTPTRAAQMNWTDPAPSPLVNAWLEQVKRDTRRVPVLSIVAIGGGVVVLAAVLGAFWYVRYRRPATQQPQQPQQRRGQRRPPGATAGAAKGIVSGAGLDHALLTPRSKDPYMVATDSLAAYRGAAARQYSTHHLLTTLLNDKHLRSRRLQFDKLVFARDLAKGAFGEVWLCTYEQSVVAVKRLLQTRKRTSDDVHAFIDEIQLTASLAHPHILEIIGVAWNTLENLCMVMEYLPNGDLQGYLRTHGATMTWPTHKRPLATGVAKALAYLHARVPRLIHRDVKARNVLLTATLDAKLIDFGVSRSYGDSCMTVGVGTPYWTAPEVLEGTVYSEKSDIYSFGVLLSELDTCSAPYQDAKTAGRQEPLQPFHILKLVMAGTLQPTFTDACPAPIQRIADVCLRRDPSQRPSALDVVAMLEALDDDEGQGDEGDGSRARACETSE